MNGETPPINDHSDVQGGYDAVADEYAARIGDELAGKPIDCRLLDDFADWLKAVGPVCDLGCGPGHVARRLHDRGAHVVGVDLSAEMVRQAKTLNPAIDFHQGDMRGLDVEDGAWAGIVAFYSIIHIPRGDVPAVLREMRRALRPGGVLLLAFHVGEGAVHRDEWWGRPVSLDFLFFGVDEMTGFLASAGFEVSEVVERPPYPDVEHPSRRCYIIAESPGRNA